MAAGPHTRSRSLPQVRAASLKHVIPSVAGATIWLHLIDASITHPQAGATLAEHVALGLAALLGPPLTFVVYGRVSRLWRGAIATLTGVVALVVGLAIHVAGVVRNGAWTGTDFTGVPMAVAGAALLVLGITLGTLAIRRVRHRLLMAPAVAVVLVLIVAPFGFAVFVTHAPRQAIAQPDLGAPYEEVAFETADGLTLRGWYVPSRNGAAVAVLHGSAGARTSVTDHARMLVQHGYGVLAFDSRGHGESDGQTLAVGWGAHPDAEAAAHYLATRADVAPGRLGFLGLSMGAELAIESAAHHDGFAAVVADGASGRTFEDARDASSASGTSALASRWMLLLEFAITALSGERPSPRLTSLSPMVTEPVLYIAAGNEQAERELVTRIAERSGGDSELWVVDGAGHTAGLATSPREYEERVVGFFDRLLLADRPAGIDGAALDR